jgi:hypothetical protein
LKLQTNTLPTLEQDANKDHLRRENTSFLYVLKVSNETFHQSHYFK